jgi:hypothetical protein
LANGIALAPRHFLESFLTDLNRKPGFVLLLLALPFLLQISPYWYPTPDASSYLSLARSIVRDDHRPKNLGSDQLFFSLGYPLLISHAFVLADSPFLLLSTMNCALGVLYMLGVYVWARRNVPEAALAITALALVNVDVLALYRRPLSEVAFMPLLIWTINLLQPLATSSFSRSTLGTVFLGSLAQVFLAMVRPAGILVAAGFAVVMAAAAWRGTLSWRRAILSTLAIGVPASVIILGFALHDRAMAPAGSITYMDVIIDKHNTLYGQLTEGARLRINEIGRLLVPGMYKAYGADWLDANLLVYVPLVALVLAGWWRLVRSRRDMLAALFPFYLALYLVWPYEQGTRFFTPLLPLLAACVWFALRPLAPYRQRLFATSAVAHLAVALGFWLVHDRPHAILNHESWPVVRHLAQPIHEDYAPLALLDTPQNMGLLFQFVLDRRVRELPLEAPVDPDIRWLVMPIHERSPAGFTQRAEAGGFKLLYVERVSNGPTH